MLPIFFFFVFVFYFLKRPGFLHLPELPPSVSLSFHPSFSFNRAPITFFPVLNLHYLI